MNRCTCKYLICDTCNYMGINMDMHKINNNLDFEKTKFYFLINVFS
jgi:hypothetical protein